MKWFPIIFILVFLYVGYMWADYTNDVWTAVYYLWDKTKDLVLSITIITLIKDDRRLSWAWKSLSLFLAYRIIWELIIIIKPQDINNPNIIIFLFIVLWITILSIVFYPLAKKY